MINTRQASEATNNKESWGKLILVSSREDSVKTLDLNEERHTLGRAKSASEMCSRSVEFGLPIVCKCLAKMISNKHATLEKCNDYTFTIKDNKSTNGTLVNGVRISYQTLK